MKNLLLVLPLLLGGCASFDKARPDIEAKALPSRLDEIAYINGLRTAFELRSRADPGAEACYDGKDLKRFNPELSEGYNRHGEDHERVESATCIYFKKPEGSELEAAMISYLESGFGLTDLYCHRFFTVASQSAQKRVFQRDSFATLDTLVGAVMTAASAGETAMGIVNGGFGAIDSTYKNIDVAFLVAPDLGEVQKLVEAAQRDFRVNAFKDENRPRSYEAARRVIEDDAKLCSFTKMRKLVSDSVSSETRDLNASADAARPSEPPADDTLVEAAADRPAVAPVPERPAAAQPVSITAPQR